MNSHNPQQRANPARKKSLPEPPVQLQIPEPERSSKVVRLVRCDLNWAQYVAEHLHYLRRRVSPLAYPFAYAIVHSQSELVLGMLMLAAPHFTRCRGLFGYPGLPTKWQVLLLSRVWIDPIWQAQVVYCPDGSRELSGPTVVDSKGRVHSLCIASCSIGQLLRRVNQDWLIHHPPRFLDQPYSLKRIVSYCDPQYGHTGVIYRATNFTEFYRRTHGSQPLHRHSRQQDRNASRKYVYYYSL